MHIIESLIASRKRQSVLAINLYFQLSVKRNYLFNIHCLHTVSINECFGVAIIEKAGPFFGDPWLGPGPRAGAGQWTLRGSSTASHTAETLSQSGFELSTKNTMNVLKAKSAVLLSPHHCEKCQLASTLTLNDVHIITVILYNLYSFWTLGAIARS